MAIEDLLSTSPRTWADVHSQLEGSRFPDDWKAAGVWAVDVLEDELGHTWPADVAAAYGKPLLKVFLAVHFFPKLAELLEFALQLRLLSSSPGYASVRKSLCRDLRPEVVAGAFVQLGLASLELRRSGSVSLERRPEGSRWPADVLVASPSGLVPVETFVLVPGAEMRSKVGYLDKVGKFLEDLSAQYDLSFDCTFSEIPDEPPEVWLAEVETRARTLVGTTDLTSPFASIRLISAAADGVQSNSLVGPEVIYDGWSRVAGRLCRKAEQVGSNRAWLRCDADEGLWHISDFARKTLAEKTATLATLVREALRSAQNLEGVVISGGPISRPNHLWGESVRATYGAWGLRRLLPVGRMRETIVIPLRGAPGGEVWRDIYNEESGWLLWGCSEAGVAVPGIKP